MNKSSIYYVAGSRPGDGNVVMDPTVLVPAFLQFTVVRERQQRNKYTKKYTTTNCGRYDAGKEQVLREGVGKNRLE